MNPREIEVHIEELVLHGVDPQSRAAIGDKLKSELSELVAQRGLPETWLSNQERLDAAVIHARTSRNAQPMGASIAQAIGKGGKR